MRKRDKKREEKAVADAKAAKAEQPQG
jgi:hypothetical protein